MQPRSLCLAALTAICLSLCSCRAKPPGKAETATLQWTKHHVTVGGRTNKNPVPSTNENAGRGKVVFGYYCVVCHGRDGQNTGVPFAVSMSPPIPSLASTDVQSYSDGQLKWIIENGIAPSGMPASKGTLSDDDMWHIVVYLRHLPPPGSLGDPRAYSGEEFEEPNETQVH